MQQTIPPNPQQRKIRIDRAHADEVQKIEIRVRDITEIEMPVEINARIINKLKRKLRR